MSILFWQKAQWQHCVFLSINNKLPQALLFSGQKGLGKLQFAHYFGSWLLCQNPAKITNQVPCGECQSCRWMLEKTHPEWFSIAPLDDSDVLSIDQIRELTKMMHLTPQYAQQRCILIEQAETLTGAASHALLKILEEPTQSTLFIVVTSYKQRLKPTILSRLTSVSFVPPKESELKKVFSDLPIWALRMAQGAPLAACELATPQFIDIRLQFIDQLYTLVTKTGNPLMIAQAWVKMELKMGIKTNQNHALYLFYHWLIDLIYIALNRNSEIINVDQVEKLKITAKNCSVKDLFALLGALEKALIMKIQINSRNDQLCFEDLLMQYSQIITRGI